ncbi:hypothetical protein GCM10009751_20370 [Myceligenerans crystallogenes]|uniref:Helix-turn-helix domain-containing protein n=1 Tax=Myceligenerans crystallogenes TaxID=316335 RepID=A0ABN2NCV8_9MICO
MVPETSAAARSAIEPLLTADELANYLKRSPQWVRTHAVELRGMKVGQCWRFDLAETKAAIQVTRTPGLSEKRPADADPWAPTPLSAKHQATKRRRAAGLM